LFVKKVTHVYKKKNKFAKPGQVFAKMGLFLNTGQNICDKRPPGPYMKKQNKKRPPIGYMQV